MVVAISGGGHRAANFGVGAMLGLEKLGLLNEVDYFSTVSGGGLAAGAYLARLSQHMDTGKKPDAFSFEEAFYRHHSMAATDGDRKKRDMVRHLERGYNNVLLGNGLAKGEGWYERLKSKVAALKVLGNLDRGDLLEESFDARVLTAWEREHPLPGGPPARPAPSASLVLRDVFRPKAAKDVPILPIWVANTTIYENGAILQFTPDVLARYKVCEATHHLELIHPKEADQYPLALGMKASASFPAAVPATTLGVECNQAQKPARYLRLLDGGISDNLGVLTAMDLFEQDKLTSKAGRRRVLIVIDAYNGSEQPFSKSKGAPAVIPVALRMMGISLDSWRGRHRNVINGLAGSEVTVVYLSFDTLRDSKTVELLNLYGRVHAVKTRFDVTSDQQADLLAAGHKVVELEAEAIRRAVRQGPQQPNKSP